MRLLLTHSVPENPLQKCMQISDLEDLKNAEKKRFFLSLLIEKHFKLLRKAKYFKHFYFFSYG